MTDPVRVVLVGRNAIVREGLSRILKDNRFEVVGSVSSVADLCGTEDAKARQVGLIIIDPVAWIADVAALAEAKEIYTAARVVALLDKFDFNGLVAALRAGAHGLVVTDICCAGLVESLRLAAMGERVLPTQVADMLPSLATEIRWQPDASVSKSNLSPREIEILRCLIMGCPNTLISRRLSISEAAVKVHVKAVLRKIPVKNRTQAAIWAVKRGITAFDRADSAPGLDQLPAAAVVASAAAAKAALQPA